MRGTLKAWAARQEKDDEGGSWHSRWTHSWHLPPIRGLTVTLGPCCSNGMCHPRPPVNVNITCYWTPGHKPTMSPHTLNPCGPTHARLKLGPSHIYHRVLIRPLCEAITYEQVPHIHSQQTHCWTSHVNDHSLSFD